MVRKRKKVPNSNDIAQGSLGETVEDLGVVCLFLSMYLD